MIPKPPPFIIEKERIRLLFNEPHNRGALSLEMGSGGLCIFLDSAELRKLSRVLWYAANRLSELEKMNHAQVADR